jgi:hypothetical protein
MRDAAGAEKKKSRHDVRSNAGRPVTEEEPLDRNGSKHNADVLTTCLPHSTCMHHPPRRRTTAMRVSRRRDRAAASHGGTHALNRSVA